MGETAAPEPLPDSSSRTAEAGADGEATRTGAGGPASATVLRGTIGTYDILEQLGQGAMGVVYLARQRDLNRIVALKVLKQGGQDDERRILRFLREAQSAGRLAHPCIVPIHDVGKEGDVYYYSMEYVLGQPLDEWVKREKPSPRRSLEIVGQVARALAYAHAEGVIHRDIKPQNIMVTGDGRPRITDFGIAKDTSRESVITQEGFTLGTPAYMSPEQALGELDRIDGRADVYSLGAVLYQLLTGRPPFVGDTAFSVLNQLLAEPPVPVRKLAPQVNEDIETICMKCLEKEPDARHSSMEALAEEVGRFLEGQPIRTRPLSFARRLRRSARRYRSQTAAGAAIVLALCGSILYGHWAQVANSDRAARENERRLRATEAVRRTVEMLDAAKVAEPDRYPSVLLEARRRLDTALAEVADDRAARFLRAEVARQMLDFAAAAADLDLLLLDEPDEPEWLYAYVRLAEAIHAAAATEHYGTAVPAAWNCELRLRAQADSPWAARASARRAIRDGRGDDAVREAEALALRAPTPPDVLFLVVIAHVVRHDPDLDDLLSRFDGLLAVSPRDYQVYRWRARVLDDADRTADAARDLETCLALQPRPCAGDLRWFDNLLDQLTPAGDPRREQHLLAFSRRHPEDPEVLIRLARYYEEAQRYEESEKALDGATRFSTCPLDVIGARFRTRSSRDGPAAAAAYLDAALREHPPELEVDRLGSKAIESLLDHLVIGRELTRAEAILRVCLARRPEDPGLIRCMADIQFELEHEAEAMRWLDLAVRNAPHDASLRFKRSRVYRRLGHWAEATDDMAAAVERSPANPTFRTQYGLLLLLHGKPDAAAEQFAEVLYLTPTLQLEERRVRWAAGDFGPEERKGDAPKADGDPEMLLRGSLARRILPKVVGRLLQRGDDALERGWDDKAERAFAAACIALPDSPVPYVHQARLEAKRESWMSAIVSLERAAQLGYDHFAELLARDRWLRPLACSARVQSLTHGK